MPLCSGLSRYTRQLPWMRLMRPVERSARVCQPDPRALPISDGAAIVRHRCRNWDMSHGADTLRQRTSPSTAGVTSHKRLWAGLGVAVEVRCGVLGFIELAADGCFAVVCAGAGDAVGIAAAYGKDSCQRRRSAQLLWACDVLVFLCKRLCAGFAHCRRPPQLVH